MTTNKDINYEPAKNIKLVERKMIRRDMNKEQIIKCDSRVGKKLNEI